MRITGPAVPSHCDLILIKIAEGNEVMAPLKTYPEHRMWAMSALNNVVK